ncbi:hypothetical protein [Thiomonas sp.]
MEIAFLVTAGVVLGIGIPAIGIAMPAIDRAIAGLADLCTALAAGAAPLAAPVTGVAATASEESIKEDTATATAEIRMGYILIRGK